MSSRCWLWTLFTACVWSCILCLHVFVKCNILPGSALSACVCASLNVRNLESVHTVTTLCSVRVCVCVYVCACKRQPVGNFWVNRVETVVWRRVSLISGLCVYKCVPVCVRSGHCLFRMVMTELPWGVCWKRGHRVNCSTQTNTHYKAARLTVTPDKIMYKPREFTL